MHTASRQHRSLRPLAATAALALAAVGSAIALPAAPAEADPPAAASDHWRPLAHYSPQTNWMNDPNGLVYLDGEYHMFYQYNPEGTQWGNMSWGHAVSTDLVHWEELDVAIPYTADYGVFSGSAVYDARNTSGLGTADNPPLVAVWTRADNHNGNQSQSLAYSTDKGRTWTTYNGGDPVLDIGSTEFRDPKVFWDETAGRWTMAVALSVDHQVAFYSSDNLIDWTLRSTFGPMGDTSAVWECPDLFPMALDGDPNHVKWVLSLSVAGMGRYFTGDWDGTTFTADDIPIYTGSEGTVVEDWESGTYDGWTTSGKAFGDAPASGDLTGRQGSYYADSWGTGDADTGSLTSAPFTIEQDYLNLLIGGGNHPFDSAATGDDGGGRLLTGFDADNWEGWTVTGDAFGDAPLPGAAPGQQALINMRGTGVLNSFYDATTGQGTDATTGTATSPEFTIDADYLNLLIGGGNHPEADAGGATVVQLLVDGEVVRTATGRNLEELNWQSWDVRDLRGSTATLHVIDHNTSGWGHILLDEVRLSDRAATTIPNNTSVNVVVDGRVVASATGRQSGGLDWASLDLRQWRGRQAQLVLEDNNQTSEWGHFMVDTIVQSATAGFSQNEVMPYLDHGRDYYAAVTWNGAPNDERYTVAWMSNWDYVGAVPTTSWRTAMTTPRRLELHTVNGEPRLTAEPVAGIETLYTGDAVVLDGTEIPEGTTALSDAAAGTALDISLALDPGTASESGIVVHAAESQGTVVGYDAEAGEVYLDRTASGATAFSAAFPSVERAPVAPDTDGLVRLRVLVDASSVEVFAADGAVTITDAVYPEAGARGVSLFAHEGAATATQLRINHLSDYRTAPVEPTPTPSATPGPSATPSPTSTPSATAISPGAPTPTSTPSAGDTGRRSAPPSDPAKPHGGRSGPLARTGAGTPLLLLLAMSAVVAGATLRGVRSRI
ncbi:GH32 C-terminal domain-containing protein [Actinomyces sp.]|uniref:GH32 C-terminal domain-containing protein n=1 Tax=Actinomyces sp. TaxID=29317 RepID=UPI0026DC9C88|nr:GH32 C-terminal domain-containing protein [Actinomyces sp.]MDO4901699.1 GH32 C-terminal domain-containing protein [Actinomyces sp.]